MHFLTPRRHFLCGKKCDRGCVLVRLAVSGDLRKGLYDGAPNDGTTECHARPDYDECSRRHRRLYFARATAIRATLTEEIVRTELAGIPNYSVNCSRLTEWHGAVQDARVGV